MKKWIGTKITELKEYYIYPRRISLAYALTVFIALLVLWLSVGVLVEKQLLQEERKQVSNRINTIGTSLALAVNQRLMITASMHSFIEAEIMQDANFNLKKSDEIDDVNNFSAGMYESVAGIRNIAIAPNGVMQFVYPFEKNKAILGYSPAQDERPNVRKEVQRAIQTGEIVLSLPYELIQGGQGLIARQAVFGNEGYWGLVNIVLDMPPLLEEAGINPMPPGLDLAILDQSGKVFFGSMDVFAGEPVAYDVQLPEGDWILVAIPSVGWGVRYRSIMWFYHSMGIIGIITIPLIAYLFINRRERLAYLVDQRTHELAQSNQTLINVLEGIDADVYVADLDTYEILFANKHLQESFKDELVGKICYKVFRHKTGVCEHCKNGKLLESNGEPSGVVLWEDLNPITERWYNNADRAIRWQDGRYVHLQIANDITTQKLAVKAIRESEERYRVLVENAFDGIYITHDSHYEYVNDQYIKLTGYPKEELCSIDFDYAILLTDKGREIIKERNQTRLSGHEIPSTYETELITKTGTINIVEISTTPLGTGGDLRILGFVRDITERKQADKKLNNLLREKDILLAEVHHRVKNNMQVIISLLGLQAGEIEDEQLRAVYEESRNRIKSMTLVHEQLYRAKEYARIDFGSYADQLASTLFNMYEVDVNQIQFELEANAVFLDLDKAIPCGLMLNEMITNSLKYAFPGGKRGKLWVSLKPENDKMILEVGDNGIGIAEHIDFDWTNSLGLQLIKLLSTHDLHGNIRIMRENGTQFQIEFPISHSF